MSAALFAGIVAGYAIAVPVGAVAVYLIALGVGQGRRTAAAGALGVAAVDGVYAAAAVFAGALLAPAIAANKDTLRWAAAAVLLVLGALMFRKAALKPGTGKSGGVTPGAAELSGSSPAGTAITGRHAFLRMFALTLVNPTTVLYFAALVAGSTIGQTAGPAERMLFVLGALAASASWQLLLVWAGGTAGRYLARPRGQRWTALIGGSMIMLLALKSAFGW